MNLCGSEQTKKKDQQLDAAAAVAIVATFTQQRFVSKIIVG